MAQQAPHGGAADEFFRGAPDGQQQNYQQQPYQQQNYQQQPNQQQPYQQQNYQQTDYNQNASNDQAPPYNAPSNPNEKQEFHEAFKVSKPKWNDLWAAILFLATCAGFIAVSGLCLNGYQVTSDGSTNNNTFGLNRLTIVLFAYVLAVAFVISFAYFWAIRAFTKQIIWITGILQIVFGVATAGFYLWAKEYAAGIVFLVFAVFYIICFISWIPRIPFSVLMLQTVIDVAKNYGHVFIVSFVGGVIATAFGAWFSVTLVAVYAKYNPGNASCSVDGGCSMAKVIGLIVFVTFAGYWITEVLKNIIHVTISGVYGSWYFCSQKPSGFPKGATRGAFKRSVTYSFGSISFGSLIVAIIQLLRQACNVAKQNSAAQGNMVGQILFCVLGCLISLLNWLVQFFNEYAFSYIALYGKAYIPAAKSTWHMMKDRGIDALVNECLINPVLSMGSVFVGYVCVLLSYLYLRYGNVVVDTNYYAVIMAYSFLIGLQICNVFMVPIKSGVATLFVAMAFDPAVLQNEYPDLYDRMVGVYPHVQQLVHA
ncbi:hypothetical protein V500_06586 [Pseudogymnoascus sp. VKM F-4518 (FW-2643)]|nr:hypothetical protein V500_06586 [Pseudogymnoascus sp. VKM F-4518 (FW-2643)]